MTDLIKNGFKENGNTKIKLYTVKTSWKEIILHVLSSMFYYTRNTW